MSLLTDTIFTGGSTRLHTTEKKHGVKSIRKSKSHGGLLAPLVRLVQNPIATLDNVLSSHISVPATETRAPDSDSRRQILYLRMNNAETYSEWHAAATELDALEGNDPWKEDDDSPEYDVALVQARLKELDDARLSCDVRKIQFLLRTALTRNLGGMGGVQLYKHSHVGTKKLIERYIDSAQKTLAAFLDVSAKQGDDCPVTPDQLLEQMTVTRASFGRSALLLSGGGTFGMNHIGVVKSLWDQRLLPRIISGASAGSIVCAVLCSKTDDEIPAVMHEFCHGDLDVFEKAGQAENYLQKLIRMASLGSLFDITHLRRVMQNLLGELTFQEAYNRTRRVLNIPVSSSSHYELPRLLNFMTAPNVIIWSAVCTSCSVPLVYAQSQLVAKNLKTGEAQHWNPDTDATWIDGSVDNDLPMTRLAEMFNVNHFIVSQVNPHVVPFMIKDEELIATDRPQFPMATAEPGWLLNSLDIARGEAVHRMQMVGEMGFMQSTMTKLSSILSQRYSGDINIFPQVSLADLPLVLTNPTPEYMAGCMLAGQRATWPKLSRIQNHIAIELALDDAVKILSARANLRHEEMGHAKNMSRPASAGDHSGMKRSKSSYKITRFSTAPPSPILGKSAPTSPQISRASLKLPARFDTAPVERAHANSSRKRIGSQETKQNNPPALQILSPSTNEEGSSDRDYFAEDDSDTTDVLSTPPPVSPYSRIPTWSATHSYSTFQSPSQPTTPTAHNTASTPTATSSDRRSGILLNLSMTPATPTPAPITAGPSSPELLYKSLFHPPGPVPLDTRPVDLERSSRPSSRRGSVHHLIRTPSFDNSGTRGMLVRKKSIGHMTPEAVED